MPEELRVRIADTSLLVQNLLPLFKQRVRVFSICIGSVFSLGILASVCLFFFVEVPGLNTAMQLGPMAVFTAVSGILTNLLMPKINDLLELTKYEHLIETAGSGSAEYQQRVLGSIDEGLQKLI